MRLAPLLAPVLLLVAAPGGAQSDVAGGLLSKLRGGGGALGGLAPSVGSAGIGNVTGLLGYCLKNQLLGAAGAAGGDGIAGSLGNAGGAGAAGGVLGALTKKPGVTQSQGFLAGKQGVLQAGGQALPLASLGDGIKQQVCKSVLGHAKGLVGR